MAQDPENERGRSDLISALGSVAFADLFGRRFSDALSRSDEAIVMAPDQLWLYTNRAHALMLLGRAGEARKLYLEHRGKTLSEGRTWEQAIEADFADFRKAGIKNPLMDEIAATSAKPAPLAAKPGVKPKP